MRNIELTPYFSLCFLLSDPLTAALAFAHSSNEAALLINRQVSPISTFAMDPSLELVSTVFSTDLLLCNFSVALLFVYDENSDEGSIPLLL